MKNELCLASGVRFRARLFQHWMIPLIRQAGNPPVHIVSFGHSYPQTVSECNNEVLHVCDNSLCGQTAPVTEFIGCKL